MRCGFMKRICIVSNDICAIKQIVNVVHKIKKLDPFTITIYDIDDIKKGLLETFIGDTIYFIDIYHIENEFLDIIKSIKRKHERNKIIILNTNQGMKSLLESQSQIDSYIQKNFDFSNSILELFMTLLNEEDVKIDVTNFEIPVMLKKQDIESVYHWPNGVTSIQYKHGKQQFLLSSNHISNHIKTDSFYTDKAAVLHLKRNRYSESLKQLLVDLHLIYHVDREVLSKYFSIDAKYIKAWSNIKKYNRKIHFFEFIIGKLMIHFYLKKQRKGNG